jgi:hypothetical protein
MTALELERRKVKQLQALIRQMDAENKALREKLNRRSQPHVCQN